MEGGGCEWNGGEKRRKESRPVRWGCDGGWSGGSGGPVGRRWDGGGVVDASKIGEVVVPASLEKKTGKGREKYNIPLLI